MRFVENNAEKFEGKESAVRATISATGDDLVELGENNAVAGDNKAGSGCGVGFTAKSL